jgi:hypothetical protein
MITVSLRLRVRVLVFLWRLVSVNVLTRGRRLFTLSIRVLFLLGVSIESSCNGNQGWLGWLGFI